MRCYGPSLGDRVDVYGVDIDLRGQAPVVTLIDEFGREVIPYPRP